MQLEIAHVLVEIGPRCRLNAEALPPQRDLVEIEFEDLLLGQHALDSPREDHFLELARNRIFVADQDVLGDLLRDRRTATRTLARSELHRVVDHCADQPGKVDTAVAEERLVLCC